MIQKIRQLKQIQPSQQWLDLTRYNLVSKIDSEQKADFKLGLGFLNWFKQAQSIALTVCLALIFFGGPWLTIKASQGSLPGDLLYSVKRISEDVQTSVVSENSKVQLQTEFASRRLEELGKMTGNSFNPENNTENNAEKVKQVISNFKDNLAGINQNLGKISISKEEAVAVAIKAIKMKEDLSKTKEEAPLAVQSDLAEAEKVVKEISQQIAAVLIKDKEQNNQDIATTTLDQEILIFLKETDLGTMTTTEEIINGVKK